MIDHLDMGLDEALGLLYENVTPLNSEAIDVFQAIDRVAAQDLVSLVDSPSVDASLKDGYAVHSQELASASEKSPVVLSVTGQASAGGDGTERVFPGTVVKILTGAKIPPGADAVVADEFVSVDGDSVSFARSEHPGRNILARGSDVAIDDVICRKGHRLSPGMTGLLAAAGHGAVDVVARPRVAMIATGDEVVAPGKPLDEGKLYASNITGLGAWCQRYGMSTTMEIVPDHETSLKSAMEQLIEEHDAIITSGGAWTSDRDMVARVLDSLGWKKVFHRIRMGPGKAVGFGLFDGKPIFILPGGPPSNLMGFLQIALPGLLKLSGCSEPSLPNRTVRLGDDLKARHEHWTQFVYGMLEETDEIPVFRLMKGESRLKSMAQAQAVASIPEGKTLIPEGTMVKVQVLE